MFKINIVVARLILLGFILAGCQYQQGVVKQAKERPAQFPFQRGLCVSVREKVLSDANIEMFVQIVTEMHVSDVNITFPVLMPDGLHGDSVVQGSFTPSNGSLSALTTALHKAGVKVMLRPIIDEANFHYHWRGEIFPKDVDLFFHSYTSLMIGYARLAQSNSVESLSVGSELVSLELAFRLIFTVHLLSAAAIRA